VRSQTRYQAVNGTPAAVDDRVGADRAAAVVAVVATRGTGEGSALAKSAKPSACEARQLQERIGGGDELTVVLSNGCLGGLRVGTHQVLEEGCHLDEVCSTLMEFRNAKMPCQRCE
jgi:hypothetical protein